MLEMKTAHRLGAITLGVLAAGSAFAWGDNAIAAWTARNAALVTATDQPIGAGAPPNEAGQPVMYVLSSRGFMYKPTAEEKAATEASFAYIDHIHEACSGLTGELIKNGGRNMPVWAQTAQQKFCSGLDAFKTALTDDAADKGRCKDLESAISYAQKAKAGEDPEAILQSAATLIAAAEKLRALPIVMTQKGKLLGDGTRTFVCK